MIDSVCTSSGTDSASGTARSGRWVVASATRSMAPSCAGCGPASIITTRATRALSARYSVWPVKGTPASLMVLFCTGAVIIAAYRGAALPRARQPRMAASSSFST
ncbi:hypothetical protein D9M72_262120 [compost metagenome]